MAQVVLDARDGHEGEIPFCIRCGAPATLRRSWPYTWVTLIPTQRPPFRSVFLWRVKIVAPLCNAHRWHQTWRKALLRTALVLVSLGVLASLGYEARRGPEKSHIGVATILGGAALGYAAVIGLGTYLRRSGVCPSEVHGNLLTLRNVSAAFAEGVEARRPRSAPILYRPPIVVRAPRRATAEAVAGGPAGADSSTAPADAGPTASETRDTAPEARAGASDCVLATPDASEAAPVVLDTHPDSFDRAEDRSSIVVVASGPGDEPMARLSVAPEACAAASEQLDTASEWLDEFEADPAPLPDLDAPGFLDAAAPSGGAVSLDAVSDRLDGGPGPLVAASEAALDRPAFFDAASECVAGSSAYLDAAPEFLPLSVAAPGPRDATDGLHESKANHPVLTDAAPGVLDNPSLD